MLFHFYPIFIYVYFNEVFVKNFTKIIIFNINFQNSFHNAVCILQNIRMPNFVILNDGSLKIRQNFNILFSSKIAIFDIFFTRLHEDCFEDLQVNSNWKFQTRATISHKRGPFNVFWNYTKAKRKLSPNNLYYLTRHIYLKKYFTTKLVNSLNHVLRSPEKFQEKSKYSALLDKNTRKMETPFR